MMPRCNSIREDLDHGFSAVEIMVCVLIVGMLAAIAVPICLRAQRNSQNNRFISDLRTFAQAYETYATKAGKWPPSAASGAVPTGMSGEIQDSHWIAANSLGGHWKWNYNRRGNGGFIAGIAITGISVPDARMIEIDEKIDDGDLSTGTFIKRADRFIYILQK